MSLDVKFCEANERLAAVLNMIHFLEMMLQKTQGNLTHELFRIKESAHKMLKSHYYYIRYQEMEALTKLAQEKPAEKIEETNIFKK